VGKKNYCNAGAHNEFESIYHRIGTAVILTKLENLGNDSF
jgi:hypothetical protein